MVNPKLDERARRRRLALAAGAAIGMATGWSSHALAQESEDQPAQAPEEQGAMALPGQDAPPRVAQPEGDRESGPQADAGALAPDEILLPAMAEPMDIQVLLKYVIDTLKINMNIDPGLSGTIALNAPIKIKRANLLAVVDALLEQRGYTLTHDPMIDFYEVVPNDKVRIGFTGGLATSRIIDTPNVKPSSLQQLINVQFGGQAGNVASPAGLQLSYVDDVGFIMVTGAPRKVQAVADLVAQVLERRARQQRVALDLRYISASAAKKRLLEMAGANKQFQPGMENNPNGQQNTPRLDNLEDRLVVSPQGNTIIFRGLADEVDEVKALVADVDRPNLLDAVRYFAGTATGQIADLATSRGLGESAKFDATKAQFTVRPDGSVAPTEQVTGGSVIVVDESRGYLVYYGTAEQQSEMEELVRQFKPENEVPVLVVYKLSNADAEDAAQVIQGLLQNQTPTATGALLPNGTAPPNGGTGLNGQDQPTPPEGDQQSPEGNNSFRGGENVFVIADKANNQIIVKAPEKLQAEFESLIRKLDLRRPQVFLQAQIVAVTATDDLHLTVESQLINAGGKSGAFNTNFGLQGTPTPDSILTPKTVPLSLSGFTAAIIQSDQVPIVINALRNKVNARVVATPQVLVDDNEEANIASVEAQPLTQTIISTGNPNTVTPTGTDVEAGPKLKVTPHISEGGYVRLEYSIELSSFTGPASAPGLAPPQQKNTIDSKSVTVPNDMTIVVGGLTFETLRDAKIRVPLLGDIPILGALFGDTQKRNSKTTLYVFLTPRIMRDPNFVDLALISKGPQHDARISPDIPELEPQIIDTFDPPMLSSAAGRPGQH